jgi:hypothetical protein
MSARGAAQTHHLGFELETQLRLLVLRSERTPVKEWPATPKKTLTAGNW